MRNHLALPFLVLRSGTSVARLDAVLSREKTFRRDFPRPTAFAETEPDRALPALAPQQPQRLQLPVRLFLIG